MGDGAKRQLGLLLAVTTAAGFAAAHQARPEQSVSEKRAPTQPSAPEAPAVDPAVSGDTTEVAPDTPTSRADATAAELAPADAGVEAAAGAPPAEAGSAPAPTTARPAPRPAVSAAAATRAPELRTRKGAGKASASTRHTRPTWVPFFDSLVGTLVMPGRIGTPFVPGLQAGAVYAGRLRFSARLLATLDNASDDASKWEDDVCLADWERDDYHVELRESDPAELVWGATAGLRLGSARGFSLSPSAVFMHVAASDYGYFLGIGLPFEWVLGPGMRVGFETDLGRAFGGHATLSCSDHCDDYPRPPCCSIDGDRVARLPSNAWHVQFNVGWSPWSSEP